MSEVINTYKLDNPEVAYPMERKRFYDEQIEVARKTGKPTLAVGLFDVLLFTPEKEIILQKRSHTKRHNPRLIDKTVGGHILHGSSAFYTAMVECVQELRIPAVVLRKEENEHFVETFQLLRSHMENVAVLELIDQKIHIIENFYNEESIPTAKNVSMFLGVYDGPMKPADRESSGILYYQLDVLEEEMKLAPESFTPDLHYFLEIYKKEIKEFLAVL